MFSSLPKFLPILGKMIPRDKEPVWTNSYVGATGRRGGRDKSSPCLFIIGTASRRKEGVAHSIGKIHSPCTSNFSILHLHSTLAFKVLHTDISTVPTATFQGSQKYGSGRLTMAFLMLPSMSMADAIFTRGTSLGAVSLFKYALNIFIHNITVQMH